MDGGAYHVRLRTVAVDFDGVIHGYTRGWQDGSIYDKPVPGSLESLRILLGTYAVFIHTSRDPVLVADWLSERGFRCSTADPGSRFWNTEDVLLVTNRKLLAIAYIDDRGIRFENWAQALADLEERCNAL